MDVNVFFLTELNSQKSLLFDRNCFCAEHCFTVKLRTQFRHLSLENIHHAIAMAFHSYRNISSPGFVLLVLFSPFERGWRKERKKKEKNYSFLV